MPNTLAIGVQLHLNGPWLGSHLVEVADEALSAHESRDYPAAVVRAGTFLEGFLARLLGEWGIVPDTQPTLGPLIGFMRKSSQAPSPLLERLNEANVIRNRASHSSPPGLSQVTEGDSLQILNIVALTVEWYRAQFHPDTKAVVDPEVLSVFLSVGGPHRLDQVQFIQRLRAELRTLGVELRSLAAGEYHPQKPFDQILDLLSSSSAALVVGLERYHAYALFEREKSDQQVVHADQRIPTSWNQIEASMASAVGVVSRVVV